jgi:hypothetical protein
VGPDALDDRRSTTVSYGEAHPGATGEMEPASGRPVEDGIAGDRLAGRGYREIRFRPDHDAAARQALGDVVVGLPDEREVDRVRREGTE